MELKREMSPEAASALARSAAAEDAAMKSAANLLAMLPDEGGSTDDADSEKGVMSILTKERRTEEGYKSVWFKEDIVPDAKEDVHIIPVNAEREDEDEASNSSGNEEDAAPRRKVLFGDVDVDSGLGVKAESDSASDSENIEMVTSEL